MIKVERPKRPPSLTESQKTLLTNEYKATGKSVWNSRHIKDELLSFSFNKCIYCETSIVEESKYMEVEHFFCKNSYPDMVVEWFNLLPSCKRCNRAKWDHDVLTDGMIIDPTLDDPKDHLFMMNYRIYGKTKLGETTETEVELNDIKRLMLPRLQIGEATIISLKKTRDDVRLYIADPTNKKILRRINRGLINILSQALPDSIFSATAATVIDTSPDYGWIIEKLKALGLWSDMLDTADRVMRKASLAA